MEPELRGYVFILRNLKRYTFHKGLSWTFQSILGHGLIPGGKKKDETRQAVFQTPTNPFGNDREEEEPHAQKVPFVTRWKHDQHAEHWILLSKAQDQGLDSWQTKSFAIMTYATIPGDCIDRVTSQDGDRVIFERLETPRLAPKATLKKNWQSQQEQHSTSNTDVPSLWKQGTKGEDQAGAQDVTDHSRSGPRHKETGAYHLEHGCGTHFGIKEVSTDALLKSEDVKEDTAETNTKAIERIKSGSNKICVREDLAKEKMMFSQESSQAIFEMGNVELIELKTS